MNTENWEAQFKEVYDAGVAAYRKGVHSADEMFDDEQGDFLASIGHTKQEVFDFIEDFCRQGEPDFETALEVAAIRYRYFWEVQEGHRSDQVIDPDKLPPKPAELGGIRWLPRIIEKARAKLRGELDPDTMYGCGGDRPFVQSVNMTLPQFLKVVWDAGDDNQRILKTVKENMNH